MPLAPDAQPLAPHSFGPFRSGHAATQSGLLAASFALTRALGGVIGGFAYAALSPAAFFCAAAALSFVSLPLLAAAAPQAGPYALEPPDPGPLELERSRA